MKRIIKARDDEITTGAIQIMADTIDTQSDPMVGIFWYDALEQELFGVVSAYSSELDWKNFEGQSDCAKTINTLHKTFWNKQRFKKNQKDTRFLNPDFTKVPRGRVFEIKDEGFRVYTGNWINDHPEVKQLVIDEFQLPASTKFVQDYHWNIGHGWSQELFG